MSPTPAVARTVAPLERRRTPRFPLSALVQYTAGQLHGEGAICEISSTGAFLKTDRRLPVGIRLRLRVKWPVQLNAGSGLWFVVNGEVLRTNEDGIALRIFGSKGQFAFEPARAPSRAAR